MHHKMLIGWFTAGLLFFVALCRSIANVIASLSLNDATNFTAILTVVVSSIAGALSGFFFIVIPGWAKAKAAARKIDDEARKGSLSAQLEESVDNQAKMRKTLHDISDQLNVLTLENRFLHQALQTSNANLQISNDNFIRVTGELAETIAKNDELRDELFSLKLTVTRIGHEETLHHRETRQLVGEAKQAIGDAIGETKIAIGETKLAIGETKQAIDRVALASSSGEFPAYLAAKQLDGGAARPGSLSPESTTSSESATSSPK